MAPEKASVLEALDPVRPLPEAGLPLSDSEGEPAKPSPEIAAQPTESDEEEEVSLDAAPTALVGFLETHFDVNVKYRGGGDGTVCTEEAPCSDSTPAEVSDAISKIYDGVMERLGDRYDSEIFYRIFFMSEDGSYDPDRNPGVQLDDVSGSVGYIVEKYGTESGG